MGISRKAVEAIKPNDAEYARRPLISDAIRE